MSKIGILSGTFDPVHAGHLAFALQAIEEVGLDKVYLSPESMPRRKNQVTHEAHRAAMLRLAIKPHSRLGVLELPDKYFSVAKTLPRLIQKFPSDELFYLCGSDMIEHMAEWEHVKILMDKMGLIVGLRDGCDPGLVVDKCHEFSSDHNKIYTVKSLHADVSSVRVRQSIKGREPISGHLESIQGYILANHLYEERLSKSS